MKAYINDPFGRPFPASARIFDRRRPRKRRKKTLFPLFAPVLLAGLGLLPAGRVGAQAFTTAFTTLHDLTALSAYPNWANSDGAGPYAGVILSGNTLYGAAQGGGNAGAGTVFKVNTDGSGFTTLHSFTAVSPSVYPQGTNADGANPMGDLVLSGNTLYGTAIYGGSSGAGTLFKVNTDGTGFSVLHTFAAGSPPRASIADWYSRANDGALPHAGLALSDNTLYGTTPAGGSEGAGTVFRIYTDGAGYTMLHNFTGISFPGYTNSDGAYPAGRLLLSGSTLYGTAIGGGSSDQGTVFKVNTDGTGFTTVHHFAGSRNPAGASLEGASPLSGLVLSGGTLYGSAETGGAWNYGTVFKVNIDGTGFTTLHHFTDIHWCSYCANANSDGALPNAGLVLSGNTLYGTAPEGGSVGHGTVFALNTDGTGFTTLHNFAGYPGDGAYPDAGLTLSGKNLYGTTLMGGHFGDAYGYGTVFKLFVNRPPVSIARVAPLFAVSPAETSRFILAPDNIAASAVLEGSQSSDPDNDPLQFAWYADGETGALATGALATNQFVIGAHSVQLVVSDGYDAATDQVTFEVITPSAAVGQLMLLVEGAALGRRNEQPLLSTLSAAMSSFDRGNFEAGVNQLFAFKNQVRAQVAPGNPALANEFIAASQEISDVVSGRRMN